MIRFSYKQRMPYKEREKTGLPRKKDKPKYKVTNWSQYNQSLRKRGMISLYFPKGDLESLFINAQPYVNGDSGRRSTYLTPYVHLIYTLYRVFGFGQRQITGYFEDLWRSKGLEIAVPSFGHLGFVRKVIAMVFLDGIILFLQKRIYCVWNKIG